MLHPVDSTLVGRSICGQTPENYSNAISYVRIQPEFPFCFPGYDSIPSMSQLRSFSAFVPEPKNRTRPAGPLPEPKGHDLPHFEAISQTPSLNSPLSSRLVSPGCRAYPAGSGKARIRRSMLANRRRVRCSLPTTANSSGHALLTGHRFSPAAAVG